MGKNIIFGVNISSSLHIDNKNKNIIIFGEGPRKGLDDATLTADAKYPINFTQPRKRFVLNLYYNGSNSFIFVIATKVYLFKAKDSERNNNTLCLGNISKHFTINNMKRNRIKRDCKILLIQTIF